MVRVTRYMLDTNTVGHLVRETPEVVSRAKLVPIQALCISAVTAGELRYGLAKRPDATRLHRAINEFFRRVDVLAWDDAVSIVYGSVRADLQTRGKTLGSLDMLIAAHALAVDAILATNDLAFGHVPNLRVECWAH